MSVVRLGAHYSSSVGHGSPALTDRITYENIRPGDLQSLGAYMISTYIFNWLRLFYNWEAKKINAPYRALRQPIIDRCRSFSLLIFPLGAAFLSSWSRLGGARLTQVALLVKCQVKNRYLDGNPTRPAVGTCLDLQWSCFDFLPYRLITIFRGDR